MVGTFFLIFTGTATAGAAALGKSTAGTPPDSLAVALAFGLVLVALVGALGQVSGAHLNAAVTLGLAVTRKFPWRYVPSYLGFQLLGAVLGAGATWAAFGSATRNKAHLGATVPAQGVSDGRAFLVEALITFLLVFVIVAVATDQRVPAAVAAPAIGFALIASVLIGGGVTGGAVNPTGPSGRQSCPGPSPPCGSTSPPRCWAGSPPLCSTTGSSAEPPPRPSPTATRRPRSEPGTAAWPPAPRRAPPPPDQPHTDTCPAP